MILLGKAVLAEVPGAKFVGEVKCSQAMYDELAKAGGEVEMWKVGHSLIKARMKETGAQLAGEMSRPHLLRAPLARLRRRRSTPARACSSCCRAATRTLAELAAELPVDDQHARDPDRLPRRSEVRASSRAVTARLREDPAVTQRRRHRRRARAASPAAGASCARRTRSRRSSCAARPPARRGSPRSARRSRRTSRRLTSRRRTLRGRSCHP